MNNIYIALYFVINALHEQENFVSGRNLYAHALSCLLSHARGTSTWPRKDRRLSLASRLHEETRLFAVLAFVLHALRNRFPRIYHESNVTIFNRILYVSCSIVGVSQHRDRLSEREADPCYVNLGRKAFLTFSHHNASRTYSIVCTKSRNCRKRPILLCVYIFSFFLFVMSAYFTCKISVSKSFGFFILLENNYSRVLLITLIEVLMLCIKLYFLVSE